MTSQNILPVGSTTAADPADLPTESATEAEFGDAVGDVLCSVPPLRPKRTKSNVGFDESPPSPNRGPRRASTGFSAGSQQSKWSYASSMVPKQWKDQLVLSFGNLP